MRVTGECDLGRAEVVPPRLPHEIATIPEKTILLISSVGIAAVTLLIGLSQIISPISSCAWKAVAGVPCVGCGGTRSLKLLASGHFQDALAMNPGAVLLTLGLTGLFLYSVLVVSGLVPPFRRRVSRAIGVLLVIASILAAVLNWLYLISASR